ncbi:MAG: glycosyltransferase family 4 protein [Candidatus Binatia bacterium]
MNDINVEMGRSRTQVQSSIRSRPATAHVRHICLVSETYAPEVNGVALTLARLAEGLHARGHTVSLVRPRQPTDGNDSHIANSAVTLVRGVPLPGYQGLQCGLPARRVLRRVWTRCRPDVIYVATEGPLGWSAVGVAQQFGISILSGFHTNFDSYSQYYGAGWLQPVIVRYLQSFHNRTLGTLVPSLELQNRLQRLGFHNVSVLARGVDTHLFTPARRCAELRHQWGLSDQDVALLYVGRVAPEKNLQLAVTTYHAMKQVTPSIKFVVVGDGPLRVALQKEHADLIFCGVRTGEELARHYASADVFLFPSETETFGNVTLEAMASGLVVIAYDYAAAKMHITHGETGVLVPYGDAHTFVTVAMNLVREPHALHNMRQRAREYVAPLDWQSVVKRFETLLTGIEHLAVTDGALSADEVAA